MLHTKFYCDRPTGSGEDFEWFFTIYRHVATILGVGGGGSCDPDPRNKLSFPRPIEASYDIRLQSAQCFRRRCLKMLTTDARLCYKLSYVP